MVAATDCVTYPPNPLSVKGACRFAPNTNPKRVGLFLVLIHYARESVKKYLHPECPKDLKEAADSRHQCIHSSQPSFYVRMAYYVGVARRTGETGGT